MQEWKKGGNYILRKTIIVFIIHFLFISLYPTVFEASPASIQSQIDQAKEGDTLIISSGTYTENISIDKPIHIVGEEGVYLIGNEDAPVITINTSDSSMVNLQLQHHGKSNDIPAISITANKNSLQNLQISSDFGFGIGLDHADENEFKNISIQGNEQIPIAERQHGINVSKSDANLFHELDIRGVLDGIYVESSERTQIHKNKVSNSRYGYHLMFTKETELLENESFQNVSGLYIMGADTPTVKENKLYHNRENNQSLGLLLFDTVNAKIIDNEIINNRIGVLIESATKNHLSNNKIQGNYVGIQFIDAAENEIRENDFIANVVQGQAENSANNFISSNYWGDNLGLDINGDGKSDLPYTMNPFFLSITDTYPPFQLLFQAPGLLFLEQLITVEMTEQLVDESPLLQVSTSEQMKDSQQLMTVFISILFLSVSIFTIYLGVKKQ